MSDEKTKIWVFYLLKKSVDDILPNDIYAFTDDKNLAKSFRQTRNPERFYEKTMRVTIDEYQSLGYENMSKELRAVTLDTKTESYLPDKAELVLTRNEEELIRSNEYVFTNALLDYVFNPVIFTKHYRWALEVLLFDDIYHYGCCDDGADDASDKISDCLILDELGMLLDIYGDLFQV